jgi:hypothetical protein
MKEVLDVVIVRTTTKRDIASGRRQCPAIKGAEGYEMALAVALEMREFSAVEAIANHVGTAASAVQLSETQLWVQNTLKRFLTD